MEVNDEFIVTLLLNSEVNILRDLLSSVDITIKNIWSNIEYMREFHPTDELIDFLIEISTGDVYHLVYILGFNGHFEQLRKVYSLARSKTILSICLIYNYSDLNDRNYHNSNTRDAILTMLSIDESELTINTICYMYNAVTRSVNHDDRLYVTNDVILYFLFRIIDDYQLSQTHKGAITDLAKAAVQNGAPDYLKDKLLEYVDGSFIYKMQKGHYPILKKPKNYDSFFQEDV